MPRTLTAFVCQQCESHYPQSYGRCPGCGAWGSLEETILASQERVTTRGHAASGATSPEPLNQIASQAERRITLPLTETARVFGGGIVTGSAILLGGEPGVGKSTLLLQLATLVAQTSRTVLYVTGEESPDQLRLRADRLGPIPDGLHVLASDDVDAVLATVRAASPDILVVDSIQTMRTEDLGSAAGSVAQVRETASRLIRLGKERGTATFLVGHVTKEGSLAGPKVLEHMVDVVLYLEGDHFQSYRILRSLKNRFGSSHEIAVFDMGDDGMHEVSNLEDLFLDRHRGVTSGSSLAVAMEGTRPLAVEVQALASRSAFGLPRRATTGIDINRLNMLTAVLAKRVSIDLGTHDVYVNVVGGLRVDEPAIDLAVALAICSSYRDADLPRWAVVGEVGLGGEIRPVSHLRRRLAEAAKIGLKGAIVPSASDLDPENGGLRVVRVDTVTDALQAVVDA